MCGIEDPAHLEALEPDHDDPVVLNGRFGHSEAIPAGKGPVAILSGQLGRRHILVDVHRLVAVALDAIIWGSQDEELVLGVGSEEEVLCVLPVT